MMKNTKKHLWILNPIYWPAWLGFGVLWLITRLPYRWPYKIGAFFGTLLYFLPTKLRPITELNIRLCLPDLSLAEQKTLVRKNFESLGIGLIEAAMAWWLPDKKLATRFRITGMEHADAAFVRGKGIILVGPHFTCLEMIGRLLGMQYSFAVMYRPHKKRLVAFIQERFRSKTRVQHIPRHRIRDLLRALQNNIAIWYAYDIDAGEKSSVFAPLFNIPAASLTSVSRLVHLSEAAVVPIRFHRCDDDFTYEIVLSPALEHFPSDDVVADATRLNHVLEEAIRATPEQYLWQYKRFKTRPPGEKRLY